ncbi:MAG TPA: CpsB/CapC family capsule biosynthesis tyrosine phosphatase [Bryobacteraceae bacterium]
MIDIHSHVLYGLDDGARTLEDSLAMLRLAAEHGTTDLVATPHASPEFSFEPDRIAERLEELSSASGGAPRLHPGCDFHLSYENIQDAIEQPAKYAIGHKNYLLVEFSDLLIFHNTAEIFARLGEAGLIPVITHPERNALLRQRADEIAQWVEAGACVQLTGQSLTGKFGRKAQEFCRCLLDRGLVHFAASDGHDCEHRPPRLDQARDWLAANYGEGAAELLCAANPRAALAGVPVESLKPEGIIRRRKWYRFWA